MSLSKISLSRAFTFIEPGPVVLVTTKDEGKNNIMTITWHMVMDFSPTFALRTGPWNHSFQALIKNRECVLAIPTVDLAEKVISIGACTGTKVDKFEKFQLTPAKASKVDAPLISECLACIECRVVEYIEPQGIFILEGVQAWYDKGRVEKRTFHANGDGTFVIDGEKIDLRELMKNKLP